MRRTFPPGCGMQPASEALASRALASGALPSGLPVCSVLIAITASIGLVPHADSMSHANGKASQKK
jgi:hypothetical protein